MFVPGAYDATTMQWAMWSQLLTTVLVFVVAYLIGTYYYFKAKPTEFLKEGLMFGIILVVISFLIEIPVMVYGFAAKMGWAWFTQWDILVGYVLLIVAAILAAYMKK